MICFPMMMYNIGMNKLLISKYIKRKEKYEVMFELPNSQQFIDFVEFMNCRDLGLNVKNTEIETWCRFAYLTINRKELKQYLNIMFIDPYQDKIQMCLFQSTSFFHADKDMKDILIKTII